MPDYTVEWINGAYVRVPKRRATRVVTVPAADVRGSSWRVWSKPRGGRAAELREGTRTGVTR